MKKSRNTNNSSFKHGEFPFDEARQRKGLDKNLIYRILLGALLVLGITFLYPMEKVYQPLDVPRPGEIAAEDIRAPFDFPIFKSPEELLHDKQTVITNLRPVLSYDTLLSQMVSNRVKTFFDLTDSIRNENIEQKMAVAICQNKYPALSDSVIISVITSFPSIKNATIRIIDSLLTRGVVDDINNVPLQSSGLVTTYSYPNVRTIARDRVFDRSSARIFIADQAAFLAKNDPVITRAITAVALMFFEPNLIFDKEKTEQNRQAELEAIPKTKGLVFMDELIIKANERLTEVHRDKLVSLARYKMKRLHGQSFFNYILPPLGRLFFIAFPIMFFILFLYFFRRNIYDSNSYLMLFALLFAAEVLLLNAVFSQDAGWSVVWI